MDICIAVAECDWRTGKKVKVAVFAREDRRQEAIDAGAHIVGEHELVQAMLSRAEPWEYSPGVPLSCSLEKCSMPCA